jgi:diaminopimelate decarboxylase
VELENNQYRVQGLALTDLAQEFGTPLYVYDAAKIEQQVQTLKNAFSETKLRLKYASKALTNINVLKLMKKLGVGMDAVSIQEAQLGLLVGYPAHEIMFTPNCVDFEEIQQGVALGVQINLDNLPILETFGKKYRDTVPCAIRFNPHIMAGGNKKISVGHADSKFGISVFQLPEVMRVVEKYQIKVNGLHIHTGSDILNAEVFLHMADLLFGIAKDFPDLKFIDFGSGFKVAYKDGDYTTNMYDLGVRLTKVFREFCITYGRELELWFEPGKYLVSEAGLFLAKATVVKSTPSSTFVGVNTGLNHLIRPMMYDAYHHIVNLSNPQGPQKVYTVVGYICETDTFGEDRKLNEVREGDIIAFKNAGAYGFSMASNYNSRFRPAEVLVYKGRAYLIRKSETMEDILRNQVEIEL